MPKFFLVLPTGRTLGGTGFPEMAATSWNEAIGETVTYISEHTYRGQPFTLGLPTRTQLPIIVDNEVFVIRMVDE